MEDIIILPEDVVIQAAENSFELGGTRPVIAVTTKPTEGDCDETGDPFLRVQLRVLGLTFNGHVAARHLRRFSNERTLKSLEETLGLGPEVAPENSETSASGTAATRVASPGPQRPSAALVARQQLEYRLTFGPHIWDGDDEPVVEDEGRQPGTAALASPSLAADYLPAPTASSAASSAASSGGPEGRQPEGRQPDDGDAEPPRKYSCACVALQEQRVPLLHPRRRLLLPLLHRRLPLRICTPIGPPCFGRMASCSPI